MASIESYITLSTTQLFIVFWITFFTIVWILRRPRNLPPGPTGLPIIGCLFALGSKPFKTFQKWGQVYGDVLSVRLGTELVVVLNSREAVKDSLVKQSAKFSSRPRNTSMAQLTKGKGILDAPSPVWQEMRKYSLRSLHAYGMARNLTEQRIHDECGFLMEQLDKHVNKPIDIRHLVMNAVSNIMCAMLFGHRFDYDDKEFKQLLAFINNVSINLNASNVLTFIPMLWYLPLPINYRLTHNFDKIRDFINNKIEKHKLELNNKNEGDCFIDSYLLNIKEYQETSSPQPSSLSFLEDPDHLTINCLTFFFAGTDTTSNTLLWAVLFLSLHPDIQEKCVQEINDVIGFDNAPTFADKSKLPFNEATALEIQRIKTVAPLGVPHMTSEAASLHGYSIPKDTMVLTNIWAVHMDNIEWENPEEFNPGRFIDDNGSVMKRQQIMPFSLGTRECLGLELAKMEIFLFLTMLLQRFKFMIPEGDHPSTEGTLGIAHLPQPFNIIIRKR
ncbi:cytochrome P450 2U1-like [Glandiceps talaboti]